MSEENVLQFFAVATEDEIREIIIKSSAKSSQLDPLLTFLIKEIVNSLVVFIIQIVNISLDEANMPNREKEAIITP